MPWAASACVAVRLLRTRRSAAGLECMMRYGAVHLIPSEIHAFQHLLVCSYHVTCYVLTWLFSDARRWKFVCDKRHQLS